MRKTDRYLQGCAKAESLLGSKNQRQRAQSTGRTVESKANQSEAAERKGRHSRSKTWPGGNNTLDAILQHNDFSFAEPARLEQDDYDTHSEIGLPEAAAHEDDTASIKSTTNSQSSHDFLYMPPRSPSSPPSPPDTELSGHGTPPRLPSVGSSDGEQEGRGLVNAETPNTDGHDALQNFHDDSLVYNFVCDRTIALPAAKADEICISMPAVKPASSAESVEVDQPLLQQNPQTNSHAFDSAPRRALANAAWLLRGAARWSRRMVGADAAATQSTDDQSLVVAMAELQTTSLQERYVAKTDEMMADEIGLEEKLKQQTAKKAAEKARNLKSETRVLSSEVSEIRITMPDVSSSGSALGAEEISASAQLLEKESDKHPSDRDELRIEIQEAPGIPQAYSEKEMAERLNEVIEKLAVLAYQMTRTAAAENQFRSLLSQCVRNEETVDAIVNVFKKGWVHKLGVNTWQFIHVLCAAVAGGGIAYQGVRSMAKVQGRLQNGIPINPSTQQVVFSHTFIVTHIALAISERIMFFWGTPKADQIADIIFSIFGGLSLFAMTYSIVGIIPIVFSEAAQTGILVGASTLALGKMLFSLYKLKNHNIAHEATQKNLTAESHLRKLLLHCCSNSRAESFESTLQSGIEKINYLINLAGIYSLVDDYFRTINAGAIKKYFNLDLSQPFFLYTTIYFGLCGFISTIPTPDRPIPLENRNEHSVAYLAWFLKEANHHTIKFLKNAFFTTSEYQKWAVVDVFFGSYFMSVILPGTAISLPYDINLAITSIYWAIALLNTKVYSIEESDQNERSFSRTNLFVRKSTLLKENDTEIIQEFKSPQHP